MISNTLPQSLIDNPILSQWIGFEQPGRVRIATGKVEIGQGILTALTQIAAEELDVAPERCASCRARPTSARPRASPRAAIRSRWAAPRSGWSAPRCARCSSTALPRRCAARSAELSIEDGKFLRAGKATGRDYWSIAGEVGLDRRASGTAPTKLPSTYRIVGRNLPRLDLPAKVAGAAFIHDIAPDDVVHARVLRRPWRGARLVALDEAAVRRAAKAPIEILREGDFVAFTAASEIAVMRAAEAARTLRALGRRRAGARRHRRAGLAQGAALARPHGRDRASRPRRQGTRCSRRATRAPSSPMGRSARLARWPSSRTARSRCGRTARARRCCATGSRARSASTASQVTVFHRQGAGAYGHNTADDAAFDAAFIATRMPGRTVRVQWSREDEFLSAPISTAMAIELCAPCSMPTTGRPTGRSRSGARRTPSVRA